VSIQRADCKDFSDVTVIIPTLNEQRTIPELLRLLTEFYPGLNVIISDDGSKDGTQQIVKEFSLKNSNIQLLDRTKKKIHGLTASVADAIKQTRTEYFVVMDGDLQHPPEKIAEIVKKIQQGNALVIGTRGEFAEGWVFSRIVMSRVATALANLRLFMAGVRIKDPMSGFFGGNTKLVEKIVKKKENELELRGYKILMDILKYMPQGTALSEICFKFGLRREGKSKTNFRIAWLFFKSLFR